MSKQDGPIVFTVTSEMQMPKVFKTGATYVAQKASAVAIESSATPRTKSSARSSSKKKPRTTGRKKTTKKSSTAGRKKKTTTKSKRTAKSSSSARATKVSKRPKSTKRKPVKPEVIIQYVQKNDGCNMTDIEGAVKLPQAIIRRILNTARDSGSIRTEGQRRGLRYFGNQKSTSDQAETVSASAGNDSESGW